MAQQPRKGMDHPDAKAMLAQRDERAKLTSEAMMRMDLSQPTPTQEENDLARLGIHVEEKQDDGSGPTVITRTTVANVPLGAHGYEPPREGHQRTDHAAARKPRETKE
jgi:hypothetical protein